MQTVALWLGIAVIVSCWLFCIGTANRLIRPPLDRAAAILALTFGACVLVVLAASAAGWWFAPFLPRW